MSEQLPIGGIELSSAEIEALGVRWSSCWSPGQVAQHLAGTITPWCVAAGWALDLFRGTQTREHGDIEIAIPATGFPEIRDRFPGFAFDVVSSGRLWEDAPPDVLAATHQTWLRDRATGNYLLDVFREPHDGETWICRHDETIRLPYRQIIHHTSDGIPYLAPELVLLFKAKHARPKDQADFDAVIPYMTPAQRRTLAGLLARVHPGHRWLAHLQPGPQTLSGGQAVYGPPIPEGHALLFAQVNRSGLSISGKGWSREMLGHWGSEGDLAGERHCGQRELQRLEHAVGEQAGRLTYLGVERVNAESLTGHRRSNFQR